MHPGGYILFGLSTIMLAAYGVGVAYGDNAPTIPDRLVESYNRVIDMKIAAADRQESMARSDDPKSQCLARRGRAEARFYKGNRDELVKEMFQKGVGEKPYKIDYFLIEAFLEANPEGSFRCAEMMVH